MNLYDILDDRFLFCKLSSPRSTPRGVVSGRTTRNMHLKMCKLRI